MATMKEFDTEPEVHARRTLDLVGSFAGLVQEAIHAADPRAREEDITYTLSALNERPIGGEPYLPSDVAFSCYKKKQMSPLSLYLLWQKRCSFF